MKIRKLKNGVAILGVTLLFLSLFCVAGVAAGTITPTPMDHKTPISFEFTNNYDETFEKSWMSDGILHMRGGGHFGDVWGDLDGTLTYMGDIQLNMETYDGTGGGIVCFTVNYGDLFGTFEGRMVLKVTGGYITCMFICHGGGNFDGMKLKGTAEGWMGGTYFADAIILNPHG